MNKYFEHSPAIKFIGLDIDEQSIDFFSFPYHYLENIQKLILLIDFDASQFIDNALILIL